MAKQYIFGGTTISQDTNGLLVKEEHNYFGYALFDSNPERKLKFKVAGRNMLNELESNSKEFEQIRVFLTNNHVSITLTDEDKSREMSEQQLAKLVNSIEEIDGKKFQEIGFDKKSIIDQLIKLKDKVCKSARHWIKYLALILVTAHCIFSQNIISQHSEEDKRTIARPPLVEQIARDISSSAYILSGNGFMNYYIFQ